MERASPAGSASPRREPGTASPTIAVTPSRIFIALALLVGGGSLVLLGAFLFLGPFELVHLGLLPAQVLAWDAALCLAFCVLHSLMVRQRFRSLVRRIVPSRFYGALFSIVSGLLLLVLVALWQPSAVVVARLEGPWRWVVRVVFLAALPGFVWAARAIPHFDPLGIGPIQAGLRGREARAAPFAVRGPYRCVRHPQYTLSLVLIWAFPDLTADRLLFNVILTVWVVLATVLEERDLVEEFGEPYVEYRKLVPMLLPWRGCRAG